MTRVAEKVTSSIAIDIRVRSWLRENGYKIDDNNWISGKKKVTFLFLQWHRQVHVGHLVFDRDGTDITFSKKWLLEGHGSDFLTMMEECGRRLSEEFNVKIHIVMETEYPVDAYGHYL